MPAPAPAENGAPKTELQEIQMKSQQVTDEVLIVSNLRYRSFSFIPSCMYYLYFHIVLFQSLESTRRMLALCEEVCTYFLSTSYEF